MRLVLAILVGAAAVTLSLSSAEALPVQTSLTASSSPTLVSGGCGKHKHRGYYDACRAGGGYNPHGPNRLRLRGPGRVAKPS